MNNAPGVGVDAFVKQDAFAGTHLGRAVFRLTDPARAREALSALAGVPTPLMIETRVPVHDLAAVAFLTALGFTVVDTGVQLDVRAADVRAGRSMAVVRDARAADRPHVERIAADNLTTSRFHLDPGIGSHQAAAVKRAWAGNFFEGRRGDRLLVVESAAGPGGFLLALEQDDEGTIDLVALDPGLRGTGALDALLRGWMERAPALTRLVVGTQVSNVQSLRAYAKRGFRVCGASYVLHYHA